MNVKCMSVDAAKLWGINDVMMSFVKILIIHTGSCCDGREQVEENLERWRYERERRRMKVRQPDSQDARSRGEEAAGVSIQRNSLEKR